LYCFNCGLRKAGQGVHYLWSQKARAKGKLFVVSERQDKGQIISGLGKAGQRVNYLWSQKGRTRGKLFLVSERQDKG